MGHLGDHVGRYWAEHVAKMGTRWTISAKLAILEDILATRWVQKFQKKLPESRGTPGPGPPGLGWRQRRVHREGKGGNKSHPGWTLECDNVILHGYSSTRRCCAGLSTRSERPAQHQLGVGRVAQNLYKHISNMSRRCWDRFQNQWKSLPGGAESR